MKLAVFAHGRERLLLDGGGSQFYAGEHRWVEDVDTGVDTVADELDRFLDEPINPAIVARLVDDDTIFGWLLDFSNDNGALLAMGLVEFNKLRKGVFADDVGVKHEEGCVVFSENVFRKLERARCAERLGLDRECDVDVILFFILQLIRNGYG